MKPIQQLNKMIQEQLKQKYPEIPERLLPNKTMKAGKANDLTKAVIKYIQLMGGQAERISVEGRMIDQRKTYTDVLGHTRQIGSIKRIKSSMTRGSADVSATIRGRSVKIEIKIGKDIQSDAQKEYQRKIEQAGGIYLVVKDFDSFYEWFNTFKG